MYYEFCFLCYGEWLNRYIWHSPRESRVYGASEIVSHTSGIVDWFFCKRETIQNYKVYQNLMSRTVLRYKILTDFCQLPIVVSNNSIFRNIGIYSGPVIIRNGISKSDTFQSDIFSGNRSFGVGFWKVLRKTQLLIVWVRGDI